MPLVKVELLKGKSKEYKNAILDGIHKALVDSWKIPEDDRILRINELEKDNFEIPPYKSENFILVELTVFKGRSFDAKKNIYKAIVDNLEQALNLNRTDIMIILNEQPLENWGIAGGKPASEIDFGFQIEI